MLIRRKNIMIYRKDSNNEDSEFFYLKKNGNLRRNKQNIFLKPMEEVCIVKVNIIKNKKMQVS